MTTIQQTQAYTLSAIQLELLHIVKWVEEWNQQHILKLDRDDLLKNLFCKNGLIIQSNQNMNNMNNILSQQLCSNNPSISNNTCPAQQPQSQQPAKYNKNRPTPKSANLRAEKLQTITEEKETQFLDPAAPAFIPSTPSPPSSPHISPQNNNNKILSKTRFIPKYPARAQLNIYIAKNITANLLKIICEPFPSPETLYYYIDISTALQINDDQMYIFNIQNRCDNDIKKVVFVNYDLHQIDNNNGSKQTLYGVIIQNDRHTIKQNKWLWKLEGFMTANDIYLRYGVDNNNLPQSSRQMVEFQERLQLEYNLVSDIDECIVDNIDWSNIQQIKSLRRGDGGGKRGKNKKGMQIIAKLDKEEWIKECKKSWNGINGLKNDIPSIPIVVNENKNNINQHWIEWIKLVPIDRNGDNKLYVGISCKYLTEKKQWMITSICLDKGDIQNKHRLVGLFGDINNNKNIKYPEYMKYFNDFNTTFTEIQWIKNL